MGAKAMKTGFGRAVACVAALASVAVVTPPAVGQGVPVIDSSNLSQNIQQLQTAIRDANNQLQQIEEMKRQVQNQIDSIRRLDFIKGALSGLNQIKDLYNDAQALRSRAAKITDMDAFNTDLAHGNFESLLRHLMDPSGTTGSRPIAEAVQTTLSDAGFTEPVLKKLSSSATPGDAGIAKTAAVNATAAVAAEISYEEAAESLARIEGLVEEIGRVATLKESIDLNTRMAAETNFMLGQMWRQNAAEGLANAQNGVSLAAEQAKQRKFFVFTEGSSP